MLIHLPGNRETPLFVVCNLTLMQVMRIYFAKSLGHKCPVFIGVME